MRGGYGRHMDTLLGQGAGSGPETLTHVCQGRRQMSRSTNVSHFPPALHEHRLLAKGGGAGLPSDLPPGNPQQGRVRPQRRTGAGERS